MKNTEQTNKFRSMSTSEIYKQIRVLHNEIIEQKENKDIHSFNKKKKDIARLKTVLSEKRIIDHE